MARDLISNKHTANINSFRLRERRANWDGVTRRNLQPVCSAAAAAADAGFPCLFFALYGHKSGWVRERDSRSEDGGVVYCFWRKRCRVTLCSWTFGASRHLFGHPFPLSEGRQRGWADNTGEGVWAGVWRGGWQPDSWVWILRPADQSLIVKEQAECGLKWQIII